MELTDQKGSIAELANARAAVRVGVDVYRPTGEGVASLRDDVVVIRCRRCRRTANGQLHRGYSADEIDAFAAYCEELDRCFFIPIEIAASRMQSLLRLAPTRNCQQAGVNWASEFDFTARLRSLAGP